MTAEIGIKLFRHEARFVAGAAEIRQLPKLFLPQIAFVGKSNVGKSSLINAVCRRKSLARVSHTPGRTRQINFFTILEKLILVDLPGYGFAKVSMKERLDWEKLITHYLKHNDHLRLVNLLIDLRRGIKEHDLSVMQLLQTLNLSFQIVFTKADKMVLSDEVKATHQQYLEQIGYDCPILYVSSRSGLGIKELQLNLISSLNS